MFKQWDGFKNGTWQESIDVRNFIQKIISYMKEIQLS